MTYDLKPLKAPRAAGGLLRTFVTLVETPGTGDLLAGKLLRDAGVVALRDLVPQEPLDSRHPLFVLNDALAGADRAAAEDPAPGPLDVAELAAGLPAAPDEGFRPESAADFQAAYRDGRSTPEAVAERALDVVRQSEQLDPAMRLFIAQDRDDVMEQARASTARWAAGETLGPLDGVPVAVKDELHQAGYPTTVGTRFLGGEPATTDAEPVARLRSAGALLIGKCNMHEIGLGVTGLNPHHGSARNPYDPHRATGGSSSGSAAAVAAGVCPVAVGADGGGSIRIPAALCGMYGIKATFGRISEHGAAELCWSVAHVGPIAATAADLALSYAVMAGPDPKDDNSLHQPPPSFADVARTDLDGLRLGIYRPWFDSAQAPVIERCRELVQTLESAGAEIVDIDIPELGVLRTAHLITIIAEMAAAHVGHYAAHRSEYGLDTRLNLALARKLSAYDYVHAQRHRARLCRHFAGILRGVDVIVTPATGCTAPLLPTDALLSGESNLEVTDQIMRFAAAANMTGLPALAMPAGHDDAGLPIGLQVMGRPWQEHVLLRIAFAAERQVRRNPPKIHFRYLDR
ncbi:MAG: amidase [Deltaproteobacteria bacterium]|jgi:Asp-tRNA(Asn)/Glu-tRNA(Gln) amidotransferase A subunit family amidase|nr:amidase [Deltaproteobacteria bacterium]MBW2535425.1 amidase [Deltaproteobacteria bacterium]